MRTVSKPIVWLVLVAVMAPIAAFASGVEESDPGPVAEVSLYDTYPEEPVTIVVPFSAGGGTDVIFRAVASVIELHWGQPLVVVNRPGSGGTVGGSYAAKEDPDGYTLFAALQGPLILNPLQLDVDYDADDFDHIVQLVSNPMPFVGQIDSEFENATDLIEFAQANPGEVVLGTTGVGNLPQLMTLRLAQLTGAEFTILPMQGNAPALRELLAGTIDGYMTTVVSAIKEGSVRGLAMLSEDRYDEVPEVPTFAELGLPEMQADVWFGVSVPAGVPEPIQQKIADTMEKVVNDPEFVTAMENIGNNIVFLDRDDFNDKMDELSAFFPGFLEEMGMLPE